MDNRRYACLGISAVVQANPRLWIRAVYGFSASMQQPCLTIGIDVYCGKNSFTQGEDNVRQGQRRSVIGMSAWYVEEQGHLETVNRPVETIARLASKRYTTASPALQGSVLDLRHLRRTGMIQSNGVVFFLAANCA
ncbi:hypothetical protein J8273_4483 [Carpediemonas membranifera]|uniref:Uncharacterized protein n=2 Tax=Carpediemonas membranifera TaxID=201153 RepID=A0A8J6DYV0_9EUKA|nr:hypothetical protein J8273_7185 [Carpediemonas membranifera]KAG9392769.1 hypothetical protein J8273_5910 [Carpediemonas membranifera]KAG9394118.1 hypothetical protein J8273_4483 [Carpediemonas membranifera]|eukprot:KAG9390918.1 hypothetical protein J8273_7185 [Carpediemonas membranifera]